jgi:NAD(P)-dependent dehydrogenase (short-subunit alcohol dehydrogenase family)
MKSIFITGAASGIGLATAKHFAAQGCHQCLLTGLTLSS